MVSVQSHISTPYQTYNDNACRLHFWRQPFLIISFMYSPMETFEKFSNHSHPAFRRNACSSEVRRDAHWAHLIYGKAKKDRQDRSNRKPIFLLERGIRGGQNQYSEGGIRLKKWRYQSTALALSITKLKADYDFDSPIESYATLKKNPGLTVLMVGIDWHRLAPRKNACFVISGVHMLRLTNQLYQNVPLGKSYHLS